jgi:hypothetical protein
MTVECTSRLVASSRPGRSFAAEIQGGAMDVVLTVAAGAETANLRLP